MIRHSRFWQPIIAVELFTSGKVGEFDMITSKQIYIIGIDGPMGYMIFMQILQTQYNFVHDASHIRFFQSVCQSPYLFLPVIISDNFTPSIL
jgi:hypothetical protein